MSKLPIISYRTLIRKLRKAHYQLIRTSKYLVYYNTERNITIPIPKKHEGDIPKGTLRAIIQEMEISVEYFISL